jgi:hypothetical protein
MNNMATRLQAHDRGMQVLIVYLYAITLFLLVTFVCSFYQFLAPMREMAAPSPSPTGDRLFGSGSRQLSFWKMVLSILPMMLLTTGLGIAGATGLLLRKAWGRWFTGVFLTWSVLFSLPAFYIYLFRPMPGLDEPLVFSRPGRFAWNLVTLVSYVIAIRFLFTPSVSVTMGVAHVSLGKRVGLLLGGFLLAYGVMVTMSPHIIE